MVASALLSTVMSSTFYLCTAAEGIKRVVEGIGQRNRSGTGGGIGRSWKEEDVLKTLMKN